MLQTLTYPLEISSDLNSCPVGVYNLVGEECWRASRSLSTFLSPALCAGGLSHILQHLVILEGSGKNGKVGDTSKRLQDGKKGEPGICSLPSLPGCSLDSAGFLHPQASTGERLCQPQILPGSSDTPTSNFLPLCALGDMTMGFLMSAHVLLT